MYNTYIYIRLIMKLKIIKSLLIPTLGITLSATTISSLTSCTNNNEIKNYLIGGSTQLSDIEGKAGSDTKSWQLSLDGKVITDNVDWTIKDFFYEDKSIDGISINKGIVSWSGNIAADEYYFYVIATYDGLTIKSPLIRLNINPYILNGGSVQLNGTQGKAGSDNKSWQLSLDGKVITDNIDWAIKNIYGDPIDGISINNGIVSWSSNIAADEYYLNIVATYDGLEIISQQIRLVIIGYVLNGGSMLLNGTQGEAGSDNRSWKLSLDGKVITDNIDWTIKDFYEDKPIDGISINNGIVSWNDNIAAGDYFFYVIATYNEVVVKSPVIRLIIKSMF